MKYLYLILFSALLFLSGCSTTQTNGGNIYSENELNKPQAIDTVTIEKILPAQVKIRDSSAKRRNTAIGGIAGSTIGGAIGYQLTKKSRHNKWGTRAALATIGGITGGYIGNSISSDYRMQEAVTIIYSRNGNRLSSTQEGRACEYRLGQADLVLQNGLTRVQPNSFCN